MLRTIILSILLPIASAISNDNMTYAPIRECGTNKGGADPVYYAPYLVKFEEYLSTQPARTIPHLMGQYIYQKNFTTPDDSTVCLQLVVVDWNCLYDLPVEGKGLALAVKTLADLCPLKHWSSGEDGGPFGFAYYMDPDTGNSYQQSLWAITSVCGYRGPQSACGQIYCQNNETHWYGNPAEPCSDSPPVTTPTLMLD